MLVGGIVGLAVGMLYAPKAGRELREDIRKKSDEFKDGLDKGVEDARVVAAHLLDEAVKKAETLSKQAEAIIRDAQEKAATIMATQEHHNTVASQSAEVHSDQSAPAGSGKNKQTETTTRKRGKKSPKA